MQFLIDNILLIAVAFVSGGMLIWPLLRNRAGGPSLTTLQATQLMNGKPTQIIDLRPADEFGKGSLPNARNIPFDALAGRLPDLKKDKTVLLVCGNGASAGRAAAQMRAAGFAEVFTLGGGLSAWRDAGLPLAAARAGAKA